MVNSFDGKLGHFKLRNLLKKTISSSIICLPQVVNSFKLFKLPKFLLCRTSHRRCSIKKGVLKIFKEDIGRHLCQNLIFNKVAGLRMATLLKRDSGTRVFLLILWNFQEHLFYRTPLGDCFWPWWSITRKCSWWRNF